MGGKIVTEQEYLKLAKPQKIKEKASFSYTSEEYAKKLTEARKKSPFSMFPFHV